MDEKNEYLTYLSLNGKSTKNPKYTLSIFFNYVNSLGIDYKRFTIRDAEEFQTFLQTDMKDDKNTYSKSTVSSIISCIVSFYNYLKKQNQIYSNPFNEIQKVKRKKNLPRSIISEEKMAEFLNYLKEFWKEENLHDRRKRYKAHVIAELMYSTGARIGEIMTLRIADIDLNRNVIRVIDSKSKKQEEYILNDYCSKVLKLFIEMRDYALTDKSDKKSDLLFGSSNNLKTWVNTYMKSIATKLGIEEFTSHYFRFSVGSHLLRAGCDMRYIQTLLHHDRLSSTMIYTKVNKDDLRKNLDLYHSR